MTLSTKMNTSALSDLGKAAVWYCEHGFGIIPIHPSGKAPATLHGLNDWFDDPNGARDFWTKFPNHNIGIVCGTPSHGLLVLDFDVDEEREKDGYATLSEWEKAHGELPPTAVAITGSGGMHYLYRTDRTNIHPSVNHDLGVDVRCDGSYIVAPPSVHPNGNRYEWQDHPEDVQIATATGAVYDFIDHVQRNGGQDETRKENGKFKLPDKIKKGHRNETLFRYASHLRAIGRSDEEILTTVAGANALLCEQPLPDSDIRRIMRSACKYERGEHATDKREVRRPGGARLKAIDGSGGDEGDSSFRTDKGRILHNKLARLIMENNKARMIDGALAVWMGTRWGFGVRAIKSVCTMYADDIKESMRNEVVKYLTSSIELPKVASDNGFDGRYYVQFTNGTWDVLSQDFVEPTPDMYIIGTLPIELNQDAEYGLADEFLRSIADEDKQTEKVMREVIGACMCSSLVVDQAPMLIGRANGITAANGKSTYIHMLSCLLGPENVSTLDIAMYGKPFMVAGLIGKLANLGDDIPPSYLKGPEASMWKRAVTGDDIKADVKYGDDFDFRPSAVQLFSMNVIPRLPAEDDGLYRRLMFLPFRKHFAPGIDGYDPQLKRKLATKECLQRFAVLGLMELPELIARSRYSQIDDMVTELDEVRTSNDSVRRWLDWYGITAEGLVGRKVADAYKDYAEYCKEAGESTVNRSNYTKRILTTLTTLRTFASTEIGTRTRVRKFGMKSNKADM